MRVLGLACTSDEIDWVLAEGSSLDDFAIIDRQKVKLPVDTRCQRLDWVRREVLTLVRAHAPELLALREAQQGQRGNLSIERVEVEGVVQAASAEAQVDLVSFHSATIQSALKPYGGEAGATTGCPSLAALPASRRVPAVVALCAALGQGRHR